MSPNTPYHAVSFFSGHKSSVSAGRNIINQVTDVVICGAVYLKTEKVSGEINFYFIIVL